MPFGFGGSPSKPIGKRRRDMRARVDELEAALRPFAEAHRRILENNPPDKLPTAPRVDMVDLVRAAKVMAS